jgi:hypothetical protein
VRTSANLNGGRPLSKRDPYLASTASVERTRTLERPSTRACRLGGTILASEVCQLAPRLATAPIVAQASRLHGRLLDSEVQLPHATMQTSAAGRRARACHVAHN